MADQRKGGLLGYRQLIAVHLVHFGHWQERCADDLIIDKQGLRELDLAPQGRGPILPAAIDAPIASQSLSALLMVPGVGLEPTLPLPEKGF